MAADFAAARENMVESQVRTADVTDLTITDVRLTPVLVSDPPLLNTQGVHQPYATRLIVEVVTAGGTSGFGETYGDTKYLYIARPLAAAQQRLSVGRALALCAECRSCL